jgi:hypothetical protein
MRKLRVSRARHINLLARSPADDRGGRWAAWIVDPAEQLKELDDLRHRGFLTSEEFEQQRAQVLGTRRQSPLNGGAIPE